MKDVQGDTALHDAVGRGRNNDDIINMLIACTDFEFKLKNKKGYNVLHEASCHGDVKLVVIITSYSRLLYSLLIYFRLIITLRKK